VLPQTQFITCTPAMLREAGIGYCFPSIRVSVCLYVSPCNKLKTTDQKLAMSMCYAAAYTEVCIGDQYGPLGNQNPGDILVITILNVIHYSLK